MVTKNKILIFQSFNGDIDEWAMRNSNSFAMSDQDWYLIDSLLQDLHFVNTGAASQDFIEKLSVKLKNSCDNDDTINGLKKYSKK
jgi:hypothetical protein